MFSFEWWHWTVLGLALTMAEMVGICIVFVLAAAIPLLKDRGADRNPPVPRKETLHDWRNQQ